MCVLDTQYYEMSLCVQLCVLLVLVGAAWGAVPTSERVAAHGELLRSRRSAQTTENKAVQTLGDDAASAGDNNDEPHLNLRGRNKREDGETESTATAESTAAAENTEDHEATHEDQKEDDETTTQSADVKQRLKKVRDWLVRLMHTMFGNGGGRTSDDNGEGRNEGGDTEGYAGMPGRILRWAMSLLMSRIAAGVGGAGAGAGT